MTRTSLRRRAGVVLAATTALVLLWTGPASADTSRASAIAASLVLAGGGVASSGQVAADHDGQTGTSTGDSAPALGVLGSQTLITSGALVQKAVARPDGTSAACAALVGAGGGITIGADGACTVVKGTGGVRIRLLGVGGVSLGEITADALSSQCTATSAGVTTASAALANAKATVVLPIALAANPVGGVSVPLGGVATLLLGGQTAPQGSGSVRVSALYVSLLDSVARIDIASATCGVNVATLPVPAVPLSGWTAAAAGVLAVWGVLAARWVRRRTGGPVLLA